MENKRVQILVEKYIDGLATPEEEAELMDWYRTSNKKDIEWLVTDVGGKEKLRLKMLSVIQDKAFKRTKRVYYWSRVAAAAAVLVCLAAGGYFLVHRQSQPPEKVVLNHPEDIRPGTNGAILTLSGGKKILLGQAKAGLIASQGQTALNKRSDSLLVYQKNNDASATAHEASYNTLETTRGHQFQVVLPDGSKVWLNAASSLKYPTAFTGKTRTVELTGEAYFEVVHDEDQPFRVVTRNQVVEDLGTHFNINAYPDEPTTQITLLEGKVKVVSSGIKEVVLNPGQKASIANGKLGIKVTQTNTEEAVAWKNGLFQFSHTDVATIMRMIARWYDVTVVYPEGVPSGNITGKIPRNTNLHNVLKIMRLSGIHFKVKGRELIVLNS